MCGIVGILSQTSVEQRLLEGLERLEYRGYDSAGIATLNESGAITRQRAKGKIKNLTEKLKASPLQGTIGIAHTRWATHGIANEDNAHPHATDHVAAVHNGIIENHKVLREALEAKGAVFTSETDTEVIVHLVTQELEGGKSPRDAAFTAFEQLEGAFAIVLIFTNYNDLMIGVRKGTPLAIGYGNDEMFLASDAYALAPLTDRVSFLQDGDRCILRSDKVEIFTEDGRPTERPITQTRISGAMVGKGEYRHYMLKEIYEQPEVISATLNAFIHPSSGDIVLPEHAKPLAETSRFLMTACGTACYAALVAKYWLEQVARIPAEVDVASELRYRKPPLPEGGTLLVVSQSGETLDTLEALRFAKAEGQTIAAVINSPESAMDRESDIVLHTLAGPEIGVASTKAFTTQLTILACLAFAIARKREVISKTQVRELGNALRSLPKLCSEVLTLDKQIEAIAHDIAKARDVLYLGRGSSFPIALEGALKLKEISYIHAEGYAAGEMKHGPIALIDENVPVIFVAPRDELFEKTASNLREVTARGGKVLLISDAKGCAELAKHVTWVIEMPEVNPFIAPILYSLPIQLLAYHTAVIKGTDVDQPRNLAKSVTVE